MMKEIQLYEKLHTVIIQKLHEVEAADDEVEAADDEVEAADDEVDEVKKQI
jgi:hypothetical protein